LRILPKIDLSPTKKEFFQVLEGYENLILKVKDVIKASTGRVCGIFALENHLYKFYYAGLLDSIEEAAGRGVKVMLIAIDSPGAIFFTRDLRRCHVKYIGCGLHEIPSFMTSDDERLFLFLEPKFSDEGRMGKPVTLYTNCTVLVKALNRIFWSTWEETYLRN